ncbi:MAG TPA: DUF885 domain-containing protein [Steroidobacteraceae bacterium]|nr:DUF885 domain-containing protein [Steroidobacteraceae bacterium]
MAALSFARAFSHHGTPKAPLPEGCVPRIRLYALLPMLLAAAAGAAAPVPAPPPRVDPETRFARLEHAYVVYSLSRFPVVGTYLGGSGFDPALAGVDGALRDYSPAGIAAEDAHLRMFRAGFAAFEPRSLSARRRIDRSVAMAQIDFLLHQHEVLRHQQVALDSYVDEPFRGVDWQLQGMTPAEEGLGTETEWRLLIARVRAIPAYLQVAAAQLDAGTRAGRAPDWRVLVLFGLDSTAADAEYFEHTLPGLAAKAGAGEALLRQLSAAGHDASAAYLRLRAHIVSAYFIDPQGRDALALKPQFRADRFQLGEAEYDWALHNNLRLGTTAAALYAQSWPVVQDTRAQLVQLARTVAAAHGWSAPGGGDAMVRLVFAQLRANAPATDADMVAAYRSLAARLVDYARSTHLFDVPADYRLDVTVTPPPLRSAIEGAAYYPAPVFKGTGVGRFYVTPTGDDPAALREQHNYAEMPDLAAHEGFPGHDWHYKVMIANRAVISPIRWLTPGAVEDSSSMWEDSLAAEGWALYAEGLLAEPQPGAPHGFYTPEEHLYQLRGQLYRDLRVRIDTGLHTGRLSFEDAVTLFSEVVDFLPGSCRDPRLLADDVKRASCTAARAAVTRYARWPTQAITYRLGKEQILALRRRAQRLYGADFSEQRFHLEFMKQGTIPSGYFAEELLRALGRP